MAARAEKKRATQMKKAWSEWNGSTSMKTKSKNDVATRTG